MVWLKRENLDLVIPRTDEEEEAPAPAFRAAEMVIRNESADSLPRPPEILNRIRQLIDGGQFPPGSRLPPERALAAQLGAGRPSVREALKVLTGLGVLETRNRSGTFVRSRDSLEAGLPAEPEGLRWGVLELLEARRILEPRAAWLAATRATEQDLLEIESARQKLETHDQDWRMVARLDCELHAAIIRGARNPALDFMNQALITRAFGNRNLISRFSPDLARMRRDHKAIVNAILMRQADAAEKAMAEHLQSLGLDFISEATR